MEQQQKKVQFVICINDGGYVDDLKVRTVYQVLSDESAAKSHYVRVVDETGEDYLYPASYFVFIDVPQEVEQTLVMPTPSARTENKGRTSRKKSERKSKILA